MLRQSTLLLLATLLVFCGAQACDDETAPSSPELPPIEVSDADSLDATDQTPDDDGHGEVDLVTPETTDAPDTSDQSETETTQPLTCVPNRDGVITRTEMPMKVGDRGTFLTALDLTWDTTGTVNGQGQRFWDLSGTLPGDRSTLFELRPVDIYWFASDFPSATYVARLSEASELLGVFELTDETLLLLGVASPERTLTYTRVTYSPPVRILQFPLEEGSTWTSAATISGTFNGIIVYYSETYISKVDAKGVLDTPYGTFQQVLRVSTDLTKTVGLMTTKTRTFAFVTECFGTVASVASKSSPPAGEFTAVEELRRLSL